MKLLEHPYRSLDVPAETHWDIMFLAGKLMPGIGKNICVVPGTGHLWSAKTNITPEVTQQQCLRYCGWWRYQNNEGQDWHTWRTPRQLMEELDNGQIRRVVAV